MWFLEQYPWFEYVIIFFFIYGFLQFQRDMYEIIEHKIYEE